MTYAANSSRNISYSNQYLDAVPTVTELFKRLSVDDQLGLLWVAYNGIGHSITPAAPGAARLQFAQGLLNQIKALPQNEQLEAMRDLVKKRNTPVCRSYGVLTKNNQLAFWYQLAEWMREGTVIPVPSGYQLSRDALKVMDALEKLEFNQQITFLRNIVTDMGIDPLA